jgi:hypothetical protein
MTGGSQGYTANISPFIKSLRITIIKLWKRKSNINARFNRIKPKNATANTDKMFLTAGFFKKVILAIILLVGQVR